MGRAWRFTCLALVLAAQAAWGQQGAGATSDIALERRAAVEQKLKLADQMLFRSAGARRVAASGNEEAQRLLAGARNLYASARGALDAGNLVAADDLGAQSLRELGVALRMVPEAGGGAQEARQRYLRAMNELQAFQTSYLLSMKQVSAAAAGATRPPELEQVRELVARAQEAAEKQEWGEASRLLDRAEDVILAAAPRLMAGRMRDYGIRLDSAAAMFEFENARFNSYEDLLAIALSRAGQAPERAAKARSLMEKARGLQLRSQDLALGQRYDEAALASQEATAVLQEALRAAGGTSLQ